MESLSRPKDTAPESWAALLDCHRKTQGNVQVGRAIELSQSLHRLSRAGRAIVSEKSFAVTTLEEIFRFTVSALNSCEISYMVVGSLASTYHGLPRSTQDIDFVCDLNVEKLKRLCEIFTHPDFYLDSETAKVAVKRKHMFNILHPESGWKIDIILKKDRDFSRREFERRLEAELFGKSIYLATAEDTVLSKLEWANDSLSERQLRDVAEVLDLQGKKLDHAYLNEGIAELGLESVMARVKGPW